MDTDEPPEVFKMQLYSLSGWPVDINVHTSCLTLVFIWLQFTTGVPPERQKVMVGGVTLQNDDWGKAKAKIKEVHVCQHSIAYVTVNLWHCGSTYYYTVTKCTCI